MWKVVLFKGLIFRTAVYRLQTREIMFTQFCLFFTLFQFFLYAPISNDIRRYVTLTVLNILLDITLRFYYGGWGNSDNSYPVRLS